MKDLLLHLSGKNLFWHAHGGPPRCSTTATPVLADPEPGRLRRFVRAAGGQRKRGIGLRAIRDVEERYSFKVSRRSLPIYGANRPGARHQGGSREDR